MGSLSLALDTKIGETLSSETSYIKFHWLKDVSVKPATITNLRLTFKITCSTFII